MQRQFNCEQESDHVKTTARMDVDTGVIFSINTENTEGNSDNSYWEIGIPNICPIVEREKFPHYIPSCQ